MFFGTNIEHAKALNRRGVFDAVRRQGRLTRADVARATGLSQQSVSNIVGELEGAGLLRVDGRRLGGRGQPGIELSVNPGGGFSVGLHVGHRRMTALLVDLAGTVVQEMQCKLPHPTPEAHVSAIGDAVDGVIAAAGRSRAEAWGVGCVLPGLVEHGALTLVSPALRAEWQDFPLAARLQDRLRLPVIVENDAAAAAVGEQLHGVGRTVPDFFYIHFGLGLGGGVVLNGRSYRGAHGHAGRIGHMIVRPGGRPCPCGNRGCLEQYVSLFAAQEAVSDPGDPGDARDPALLTRRWQAGDERLLAWLGQAAVYLRHAIHAVETLFDVSAVVLGGDDMPAPILDALAERLPPLLPRISRPGSAPERQVLRAAATADLPALGAAALPIARTIEPDLSLIWDGGGNGAFGGAALANLFGLPNR